MILVKQSMSVAATYGLKVCLFDDVNQRAIAYFYNEELAELTAYALNKYFVRADIIEIFQEQFDAAGGNHAQSMETVLPRLA